MSGMKRSSPLYDIETAPQPGRYASSLLEIRMLECETWLGKLSTGISLGQQLRSRRNEQSAVRRSETGQRAGASSRSVGALMTSHGPAHRGGVGALLHDDGATFRVWAPL